MIVDYSAEIKITMFQSVWQCQLDEWKSSSNFGRIAAKIVRYNSVNSEIVGRKFTKFEHDVDWFLLLKLLKADLRSANPLSNAEAKSKRCSMRRRLYNFLCLKLRVHWTEFHQICIICTEITANYCAEIKIAIFQSVSKRQWRLSSFCRRIAAKIARFNSVNSDIIGRKYTKFRHDVHDYCFWKCWKLIYDRSIRCWMAKQRVKVVLRDVCKYLPNLTGCHSNVLWATAKQIFGKSSPLIRLPNL